jgi:pimeloyl-ACP methyl ester carboxylesterase
MLERQCPESSVATNDRYKLRVPVDVSKITCPALCIAAGRDWPLTHPPGQDAAVGEFYSAENVNLPEAAHCLMIDVDWKPGFDIILEWYNRTFPA